MDRFDDDTLFADLRAMRPTPRPEFAAELDERAAAGFPRRPAPSATATPFVLLADLWRGMSLRRRLVPVMAVAVMALVIVTAVVAISHSGGGGSSAAENATLGYVGGGGAVESTGAESGTPGNAAGGAPAHPSHAHHGGGGGHKAGQSSGETVYEVEVPSVENAPTGGAATSAGSSAAESEAGETSSEVERSSEESFEPESKPEATPATHGRDIERSAYVILGTKPGEVSSVGAKVYEAVHAAHGVVLHSRVQSGTAGATGAYFELLIPTRKVDDALAAFSQAAEVRQRHDATNDITAPTVGAAEELRDSNASIEGLLKELGETETEVERESTEARLREERNRHASIRGRLDHLDKRASMSEVTVRIVTDGGAGVTPVTPGTGSGNWGVGDALHVSGHILTIAAGVLLIALAVLAPTGLIALAFWLANRVRVRRLRERTLG